MATAVGHVCVVVMCLFAVEAVVKSGKAYCRDPDTGKFHPINSTWASKSFCGHYTCKLRKQNTTVTEYTPLREINITNIPELNNMTNDNLNVTIDEISEPEIEEVINKNFVNITETVEILPLDKNQDLDLGPVGSGVKLNKKGNEKQIGNQSEDVSGEVNKDSDLKQASYYFHKKTTKTKDTQQNINDRLLTKNEIKSISEALHTMRRSELDAIVDIYKLAQEIYNEIDETSIAPATNTISDERDVIKGAKSYWYDPYHKGIDMDYQDTSQVIPTYRASQPKKKINTFYTGSALPNDDFQRLSYRHFVPFAQNMVPYPMEPTALTPEIQKPCSAKQTIKGTSNQNIAESSYILPYPFAYIQQYNLPRDYPKGLLYNVPYTWDYSNSMKKIPSYPGYIGHIPGAQNTLLTYPHVQELNAPIKQEPITIEPLKPISTVELQANEQELLRRLFMTSNGKSDENMKSKKPSNNILKELKPDPIQFLGPLTPRKMITFEKIGKVLNLNDTIRRRRSVDKERRVPDPIVKAEDKNEDKERIIPDPIVEVEDKNKYEERRIPDPIVEVEDKNKYEERRIPDPIVEEEDKNKYEERRIPDPTVEEEDKNKYEERRIPNPIVEEEDKNKYKERRIPDLIVEEEDKNKYEERRIPDPIVEEEDKNKYEERRIPDPIVEEEDTETYLEKATCQSELVPGYFRVGNLSEPYPACCPQLITNT